MKPLAYLEKSFQELGFSRQIAKAYYIILKADGLASASYIKKMTRASTAGTYRMIEELLEAGLIRLTNTKRPITYAAVPLLQLAKKFASKGKKYYHISDQLNEMAKINNDYPTTLMSESKSSLLQEHYLSLVDKIDDYMWCVGSNSAVIQIMGENIEKAFIKERSRKGKYSKSIIFDDSEYSRSLIQRDTVEKRESKIIPFQHYPVEFSCVFGNTIIDYYKSDNGKFNLVKQISPTLAQVRQCQYQLIWDTVE